MADEYTFEFPFGQNYSFGDSPYYKDEGDPVESGTYRHQRAMWTLFPVDESLLDNVMIEVT